MTMYPDKEDAGRMHSYPAKRPIAIPEEETLEEMSRHPGAARVMFAPIKVEDEMTEFYRFPLGFGIAVLFSGLAFTIRAPDPVSFFGYIWMFMGAFNIAVSIKRPSP